MIPAHSRRVNHGRDPWHRRDALSAGNGSRRAQTVAAGADAPQRSAHSRAHAGPRELAGADARGVGRRRRHHVAQGAQGARLQRLPQDPRGDRRLRARLHRHVGRRPVRELQGRHHPAVLRARVRAARVSSRTSACAASPTSGASRPTRSSPSPATTRPDAISRGGCWRRHRHVVRLQAAAPGRTGPRLRQHAALSRSRPEGIQHARSCRWRSTVTAAR